MVFWFPRQGHMAGRNAFPRICIALGLNEPAKLLNCAEREVDAGESFFEFRLDYLENPLAGVEAIRTFLARHPEFSLDSTANVLSEKCLPFVTDGYFKTFPPKDEMDGFFAARLVKKM